MIDDDPDAGFLGLLEDIQDRNEYENARSLNVHRISDHPEARKLVDRILPLVEQDLRDRGRKRVVRAWLRKHVNTVILNLYVHAQLDPHRYVMYSRNKKDYQGPSRYNKLFIKYDGVRAVTDSLERLGLIEHKKGFKDRVSGVGRQSRMRATEKLRDMFSVRGLTVDIVDQDPGAEIIWLRDANKKAIDYSESDFPLIKELRAELVEYNKLLSSSRIEVNGQLLPKQYLHRVFSNGKEAAPYFWLDGGRFYGGDWELWDQGKRGQITINGQPTCEVDYVALHFTLLYQRCDQADPYSIDGFSGKAWRKFFKILALIVLNSKDRESARRAVQRKINQRKLVLPDTKHTVSELIEVFERQHQAVAPSFYKNAGLGLQMLDSILTEKILKYFTKKEILVLPVHDSYVVANQYEEELRKRMETELTEILAPSSDGGGSKRGPPL